MQRAIVLTSFGFLAAFVFMSQLENAKGAETNVFEWAARPRLTTDQQKLLQLRSSVATLSEGSPLRASQEAQITALGKQLGPLAVRRANPYELVISPGPATNVSRIFNPTRSEEHTSELQSRL